MKMFATEYIGGSLTRIPSGTFRAPMLQGCCFPCDSAAKKVEVLVAQSCLTLCGSMDHRLPGFFVHGILYARIMEWVVISFFRVSSWPRDWTQVSCIAGTGKESTCKCGRHGFDPWVRKTSGEENGNPLQLSCLGKTLYSAQPLQVIECHMKQIWNAFCIWMSPKILFFAWIESFRLKCTVHVN